MALTRRTLFILLSAIRLYINVSNQFAGQRRPMNRLTIIFLLALLARSSKDKGENPVTDQSSIDSSILITDSTTILGERYFGFGTKGPKVIVLNSKGDTVLNQPDLYFEFEFQIIAVKDKVFA
jgi:hypothetical protein